VTSHQFAHRGDDVGFFLEAAPLHPVLMATASPGLGQEHRDAMLRFANMAPHLALMIDGFHPSEAGGTVSLRPSGAPVLDYVIPTRIQDAMREAQKVMAQLQFASGATHVGTGHDPPLLMESPRDIPLVDGKSFRPLDVFMTSAHVMGGCAMGEDPGRAFVRSEDLRAHAYDNLHVVDGSVFPTSLGVNPQQSIYGLARLASTRMASSWGA
jgi:choline dehydrogenase-like flavoprotein